MRRRASQAPAHLLAVHVVGLAAPKVADLAPPGVMALSHLSPL